MLETHSRAAIDSSHISVRRIQNAVFWLPSYPLISNVRSLPKIQANNSSMINPAMNSRGFSARPGLRNIRVLAKATSTTMATVSRINIQPVRAAASADSPATKPDARATNKIVANTTVIIIQVQSVMVGISFAIEGFIGVYIQWPNRGWQRRRLPFRRLFLRSCAAGSCRKIAG